MLEAESFVPSSRSALVSNDKLMLLPVPRHITFLGKKLTLSDRQLIVLNSPNPLNLRFTATRFQQCLRDQTGLSWDLVAGNSVPSEQIGLTFAIRPAATPHPQGYTLSITGTGISITASTPAGAFYGSLTLGQILSQYGNELPTLQIKDWPDFAYRGVMFDVSRDKVPTMQTLFELVDMLASWKINQFQLYTEHTFAYRRHPEVWADASPLTGEEILALDAYCRERFIELVPNQNCFGHMRRWLVHDRYRPLAECPAGCDTAWGFFEDPFTLCPGDPGSLDLIRSLMDELLPHFGSRQFNVGCDETVDLGQGRSRKRVAEQGLGQIYLDFLLKIYREVSVREHTMQFWGDIVMAHPELVSHLPQDVIALEWGYEADHPFAERGAKLAAAGLPFYVCPGTSSWNSVAGRTDNALANLRRAAEQGLKHGAGGYLITDWGDNGHWQPLPVSYLGFASGAALAWAYAANIELDVIETSSRFAFGDEQGIMGRLAHDLGNAYLQPGPLVPNDSILFQILQQRPPEIAAVEGLTAAGLVKALTFIDQVMVMLPQAENSTAGAELVRREFLWAADMLRHACRRGMWALGQALTGPRELASEADKLLAEHQYIWTARNRPGGLKDSQARLERMRRDYEEA